VSPDYRSPQAARRRRVDQVWRKLNFIYQEERSDGRRSNFFRLESPDREDG
jgi:hypothetical protein